MRTDLQYENIPPHFHKRWEKIDFSYINKRFFKYRLVLFSVSDVMHDIQNHCEAKERPVQFEPDLGEVCRRPELNIALFAERTLIKKAMIVLFDYIDQKLNNPAKLVRISSAEDLITILIEVEGLLPDNTSSEQIKSRYGQHFEIFKEARIDLMVAFTIITNHFGCCLIDHNKNKSRLTVVLPTFRCLAEYLD